MVIVKIENMWDIGRYFNELKDAGLVQNRDWVYEFTPPKEDGRTRVAIQFLHDSMGTLYALKWA